MTFTVSPLFLDRTMAPPDRRAREKHEVQDLILNAARELFVLRGYEQVTMRQIAEAVEYTPGALYVHFKDKAELFVELCKHDMQRFETSLRDLSAGEPDPLARIVKMARGYLDFARAHPRQYELMFMTRTPREVAPTAEELAHFDNPQCNGYAFLAQCAREAIDAGMLRPGLTDHWGVAQTFWAGLHGVAACYITFEGDPSAPPMGDYHAAGDLMREALIRGMVSDQAHTARVFAQEWAAKGLEQKAAATTAHTSAHTSALSQATQKGGAS